MEFMEFAGTPTPFACLVTSDTKFDNIRGLTREFKKGNNFAKGARYTQRHIIENADEFAGKNVRFEQQLRAGENARRVDVVVDDGISPIFYEFKSTRTTPPMNFARQFLADLQLPG